MFFDNWTVLKFELRTCAKTELFEMELFFDIETVFTLNWIV